MNIDADKAIEIVDSALRQMRDQAPYFPDGCPHDKIMTYQRYEYVRLAIQETFQRYDPAEELKSIIDSIEQP